MTSQIVCFGAAHVDVKAFSQSTVLFGAKNPVSTKRSFGGVARNIAENLSRMGLTVSLFSRVGSDELGHGVLRAIREHRIECSHVTMSGKFPTASYTALLEPDGSLAVAFSDMAIYDEIFCDEEILMSFAGATIWLVDANLPITALEQIARCCPKHVELWAVGVSIAKNQRFVPILDRINLLIINQQEYLELMSVQRPARVLMTQGKQGAVLFTEEGLTQFSAIDSTVVDVTGAGDGFSAGLIYGYLATGKLIKSVPYAMSAAKLTVETADSVSQSIHAKVLNEYAKNYVNEHETRSAECRS